jgi:hypothetical protein
VSELALKHQGEEIAANRASTRQAVFRSQYHFSRKPEDFPVNWRADYGRYILVFGNKGSGYDNVKARLRSTFGDSLARSVDFSSPHERACSAIKARASRASRLRCLRNKAPSLALIFCLRSLSAYWRKAVRTRAVGLLCLDDVWANSSSSFEVASSIAIFFMQNDYSSSLRLRSRFDLGAGPTAVRRKT